MATRTPFIGGNWKMHLTRAGAAELARSVAQGLAEQADAVETAIFPAFVHLDAVAATLAKSAGSVALGSQNVWPEPEGAYTGEVSTAMLSDLGVNAVLAGHSERRHLLGESDKLVGRKVRAILDAKLLCVLCIGETLEERQAGATDAVNRRQLLTGLADVAPEEAELLVLAYEPVWAIGTGKTASPDDAQAAHATIRAVIAATLGEVVAAGVRVIYGGSVKPANAADLFAEPDIDGALVGGASLDASSFLAIREAACNALETS